MKNNIPLTLLAFVMLGYCARAQETVQVGITGAFTVPSEELKKAVYNPAGGLGIGFGTNVLFNPKGRKGYSPVFFGVDFNYVTFGRDKQEQTSNSPPYKTSYNYYSISGLSRLFLTDKTEGFTPFVDGMLGLKVFNTRTKIDKNFFDTVVWEEEEEVLNTTNDTGLGYGLGLGFYTRKDKSEGGDFGTFTLRVLYLWGDKTSYVKRGSVKVIDNSRVEYETGYTRTNMILIQLGINIF
jgi:hypothetical protein